MPPRSLWSGSITFGLVNVPVRIYSAVREHKLHFHLVHARDDGPIGYQKICKLDDKPVPNDEIVKAFEHKKGELVHLTDEDFVPYDDIDPTFFAHTYLVAPGDGGEKTYALLVRAMEKSGLAGIGKFVMRNRQYLGCLRVRGKTLTLEQMHFADEVAPPAGVIPDRLPSVSGRELDMALDLISAFSGKWEPKKYKDTYAAELRKVVRAKVQGKEVHRTAEPEPEEAPDLMAALRASVEHAQGKSRKPRGQRRAPAKKRSSAT